MKKFTRLLTSVTIISCVLITGCVSNSEYEELERRVAYLENQTGIKVSIEHDSSTEDEKKIESTSIEDEQTGAEESSYTYYIDGLSAEEVVEECKYWFSNIPYAGETYEEFYKTIKVTPISVNGLTMRFCDDYFNNEPTEHDVITSIEVEGFQTEMDGTIGYSGTTYSVTIDMIIKDYNKAESVYSSLYDVIIDENYEDIEDNRDSTFWYVSATYWIEGEGGLGLGGDILSMSKTDNGYNLSATYRRERQ